MSLTSSLCHALKTVAGASACSPAWWHARSRGRGHAGNGVFFSPLSSGVGEPFPGVAPPAPPHAGYVMRKVLRGTRGIQGNPSASFQVVICDLAILPLGLLSVNKISLFFFFSFTFGISLSECNYRLNSCKSELCISELFKYILGRSRCRTEESRSIFLAGRGLENNLNPLAFQVYTKDMFPLLQEKKII